MSDTLRRELGRWGFSDTEIDVYLTVLELGEGAAADVADRADVSTRHVYRICGRLEERGLVDVDEHVQPTQLRARPPSVVEEVIERSYDRMTDEIESAYARTPDTQTEIEVLKRQPTVLERTVTVVDEAERWIILLAPPALVERIGDALADAVERGILVFLVTTVDSLTIDRPVEEVATVVRTREGPMGFQEFGLGVDKIKSLMVSSSARIGDEHRYTPALYLDDETIGVRTNDSMFGIEWRLSDEHVVPDPEPLPYETDFFRELVLQAALHQRQGTDLHATVRGRSNEDDRSRRFTGSVQTVRQGMVEPYNQTFVGERTLVLSTDDGRRTVGGPESTLEDVAATEVTLRGPPDD